MAVSGISNISPTAALSTPVSPARKPPAIVAVSTSVPRRRDTVTLSVSAQVHRLGGNEQTSKQVHSNPGLSTTAISGYLGAQLPKVVVKTQTAPAPVTAPSAAPEEAPTTPIPASQLPPN